MGPRPGTSGPLQAGPLTALIFPVRSSFASPPRGIVGFMKTLCASAVALSCFLALARADEGAFHSLMGMARAAQTDRGPDAGPAPVDAEKPAAHEAAPSGENGGEAALRDALHDALADLPAQKSVAAPRAPAPASAATAPRLWSRLYSTLIPSWRANPLLRPAFAAPVSTAAVEGLRPLPALLPPPDSDAVKAGERRGLAEFLSSSAAPVGAR